MPQEYEAELIPLDTGGYDSRGISWGLDAPLFCVSWEELIVDENVSILQTEYIRAQDADDAIATVKLLHEKSSR